MAVSDGFAAYILERAVRGRSSLGSLWLGVTESQPQNPAELAASTPCPVPPLEVPLDSSTWTAAGTSRLLHLVDDPLLPEATDDCDPGAWVLYEDEAMTTPLVCGWLVGDHPLLTGKRLHLPGPTVHLKHL